MQVSSAAEAIVVLNRVAHRGTRSWEFDPDQARVYPEVWHWHDSHEPAPALTVFEAMAIARGLVAIGAYQPPARLQQLELA